MFQKIVAVLVADGVLENAQMTFPHHIRMRFKDVNGELKTWGESDFMSFWMMVLGGLNPDQAREFYEGFLHKSKVDWAIFNNHALPKKKRIPQYKKLAKYTQWFIGQQRKQQEHQRVGATGVLAMPDSYTSLGATTEQRVSVDLGIPVYHAAINIFAEEFRETLLWQDPVFRFLVLANSVFVRPIELEQMNADEETDYSQIPLAALRAMNEKPEFGEIPDEMMRILLRLKK